MRWVAAAVAVFFAGTLSHVAGQAPPSIWDGVFTAEQAERGRFVVQTHCSECHHEDLRGGEAPALIGPTFMIKWETHTVERLFHKIRDTMPTRGSRDVTEAQKLDSVAFILQQNGFPAGATELKESTGDARGNPYRAKGRGVGAAIGRARAGRGMPSGNVAEQVGRLRRHRAPGDHAGCDVG